MRPSPLWALAVAILAVGIDAYIVAGVLPAMAVDLGEPISAVGLLASAYALPTALLAPVFGPLSDRRGRRTALTVGLVIFIASAAACVVAPSLALLIVARGVNGLGAAIILPAAYAYAGDLPDPVVRSRAMGILAASYPMATLIGLPIGALIATLAGWRGTFVFITLVGVLALLGVRALCPPDRPGARVILGYRASYGRVLHDRRALGLLVVTFAWFVGPTGVFVYLSEFMHITHGLSVEQAGLTLVVVGLVGVVASRTSGRVMAAIGPRTAVLAAIVLFGSAVLVMPLTAFSLPLSLLLLGVWAAGTWFGMPAMQSIVAAHSESVRGTLLAFNASALSLAGVVGPAITGSLIAMGGFGLAMPAGSVMAMVAFLLAWRVLPRRVPPLPSPVAGQGVTG